MSRFHFAALLDTAARIDRATGLLKGVSVITEGIAKGHGQIVDRTTVEQVKAACEKFKGGVKVKADHWTGIGQIIGYVFNFSLDTSGDKWQVRADLQLYQSRPDFAFYLDLFETIADNLGLSVFFAGVAEKEKETGIVRARCTEIYSVDLVTEPAANEGGLFDIPGGLMKLKPAFTLADLESQITAFGSVSPSDLLTALKNSLIEQACECKTAREKVEGERDTANAMRRQITVLIRKAARRSGFKGS